MIKLENVSKKYIKKNNSFIALQNVSLEFPNKGLILIKGKSGAGKTTLLNIIAKIDKPTSGTVTSNTKYNTASIIYQDAQLIDDFTVYQNLKIISDMYSHKEEDIDSLLKQFELEYLKNKLINEISGGERQRIAIIRALLSRAPVLLCDEPTSNLDIENAKLVVSCLEKIAKDKLVIVSTHDVELFEEFYDGYVELSRGEVIGADIPKDDTSDVSGEYIPQKISQKELIRLSFKGLNKTFPRFFILLFSLVLSLLVVVFTFNFSTLNSDVVKLKQNNTLEYINFKKVYDNKKENIDSMYIDDYQNLNINYIEVVYIDINAIFEDYSRSFKIANMVYYMDECPYTMLCGDSKIDGNEVLIPSYYADTIIEELGLNSYVDLMGFSTGLFKNNVVFAGVYDSSKLEPGYMPLFVRDEFGHPSNDVDASKYELFYYYNTNTKNISSNFISHDENAILAYDLKDNEILITSSEALPLVDNDSSRLDEVIGQNIELTFIKPTYFQTHTSGEYIWNLEDFNNYELYEFKIVGIVENACIVSNNTYHALFDKFYTTDYVFGFATNEKLNMNSYLNLKNNNYFDATQYTYMIDNAFLALDNVLLILLVLGIVMLVISIGILLNYMGFSQINKMKEVGILTSFGAGKKQMKQYLLIDTTIGCFVSLVLSNLYVALLCYPISRFLLRNNLLKINVLYYSGFTPLISLAIFVVFLCASIIYVTLKYRKKTAYDLIYSR